MTVEMKSPAIGAPESAWFDLFRDEVHDDRVGWGLAEVVGVGRRKFGLAGDDLIAFVRRAVAAMVAEGARPHHFGPSDRGFCSPPHVDGPVHYGDDTPDEVVDGVVATWVAEGMKDLLWGDFRFSLPEAWEA